VAVETLADCLELLPDTRGFNTTNGSCPLIKSYSMSVQMSKEILPTSAAVLKADAKNIPIPAKVNFK
jgi:hypothetical protein